MNIIKPTGIQVFETQDYGMFKTLTGNRSVLEQRVKKILHSISMVGYVKAPVIVNENYEVIDGQGRLESARRSKLPVYFIILPGIGLRECVAMNMNQTNWQLIDYIKSYADNGVQSYIYLRDLCAEFSGYFRFSVIMCAATGIQDYSTINIKQGRFVCDEVAYKQSREVLLWLTRFKPIISKIPGRSELYYMSLIYCYGKSEIDKNRLYEKINVSQASLTPVATMLQALEQIEGVYNKSCRSKVYIKTAYQKDLDERYKWYGKRYRKEKREGEE